MTAEAGTAADATGHRRAPGRLIWLDVARGVALVAMSIYHFAWDLELFGYTAPGTTAEGAWKLFARSIASSFLFLAGFSLVLGHHPKIRWRPFLKRLAMIVAAALAITLATYVATPDRFIFFGILHGIAAGSVVGLLFLRAPPALTILAAIAAILAPHYLRSTVFDVPALWWVGLSSQNPPSNDYVPLFPWLGPVLFGIAAARIMKANHRRGLLASNQPPAALARGLAFAGRHSLLVYLVHQPVLIALLYGASLIAPAPAADPTAAYRMNCTQSCQAGQSEPFCSRFCDCTLDGLTTRNLFDDLTAGTIDPATDSRIAELVNQCTMEILEE